MLQHYRYHIPASMACLSLVLLCFISLFGGVSSALTSVNWDPTIAPTLAYYVNSYATSNSTLVVNASSLAAAELSLANLPLALSGLSSSCANAVSQWTALMTFMPSDPATHQSLPPCASVCTNVVNVCSDSSTDLSVLYLFILGLQPSQSITPALVQSVMPNYCSNLSAGYCSGASSSGILNLPRPVPFQPPVPRCEAYSGIFCSGVVASSVYIPYGYAQQDLEAQVSGLAAFYEMADSRTTCANITHIFFCNNVFAPCDSSSIVAAVNSYFSVAPQNAYGIVLNTTFPKPQLVSKSTCTTFTASCGGAFDFTSAGSYITGVIPPSTVKRLLPVVTDWLKVYLLAGASNTPATCNELVSNSSPIPRYPSGTTYAITVGTLSVQIGVNYPPLQLAAPVPTGKCIPFSSQAIVSSTPAGRWDSPTSYCENIVAEGTPVYLPAGYSGLWQLNDQVRKIAWAFGVLPTYQSCAQDYIKYVCSQAFLYCQPTGLQFNATVYPAYISSNNSDASANISISLTASLPSFPCQTTCQAPKTECAAVFAALAVEEPIVAGAAPNCTAVGQAPAVAGQRKIYDPKTGLLVLGGQSDWPTTTTSFVSEVLDPNSLGAPAQSGNGQVVPYMQIVLNIATQCSEPTPNTGVSNPSVFSSAIQASSLPVVCPYPTVNPYLADSHGRVAGNSGGVQWIELVQGDATTQTSCALQCPDPIYTPDQYRFVDRLYEVVTLLSFCLTVFLNATFLIFPEKRDKRNIIYFLNSTVVLSIAFLISSVPGADTVTCLNGTTQASMQNPGGACILQGFLIGVVALMAVHWWMIQAVDVLIQVFTKKKLNEQSRKRQRLLYHLWCWGQPLVFGIIGLATNSIGYHQGIRFCVYDQNGIALFYSIVLLDTIIGTLAMSMIIVIVVRSSRASKHSTFASQMRILFRPILFIGTFLFVWITICAYEFYGLSVQDDVIASTTAWVQCKLVNQPLSNLNNNSPVEIDPCGNLPPDTPTYSLYGAFHFVAGAEGLFVWLMFGTEKRIYGLWYNLLFKCKFPSLKEGSGGTSVGSKSGRSATGNTSNKRQSKRLDDPYKSPRTTAGVQASRLGSPGAGMVDIRGSRMGAAGLEMNEAKTHNYAHNYNESGGSNVSFAEHIPTGTTPMQVEVKTFTSSM